MVVERAALTGAAPAQVMGDTAYGATTVQTAVTAVAPDTAVVAPVPPATNPAGRFPKGVFTLDLAAETLTCPQGATVAYGMRRPRADGVRVARWAAQATPAWQAHYRLRSHVEHVQAQQSRHGGRQGRYWGLRKNLGQARLVAALYNILELARVAVLPPPPLRPRETYA